MDKFLNYIDNHRDNQVYRSVSRVGNKYTFICDTETQMRIISNAAYLYRHRFHRQISVMTEKKGVDIKVSVWFFYVEQ